MNVRLIFLVIALLIFDKIFSQNAPVTTIPGLYEEGPVVNVPVKVAQFNDVGALSLTLQYNPAIIQMTGLTPHSSLAGLNADWTTLPGRVTIAWYNMSGVTLPDSTVLFTLHFSGLNSGMTSLTWIDNGSSCEYAAYYFGNYLPMNDAPSGFYFRNGFIKYVNKAPVTLAPVMTAIPGESIVVPVKVIDFENIGAVSLSLEYDPAVLDFTGISFPGFPDTWYLQGQSLTPGKLLIAGFGPAVNFLPDSSAIIEITFLYNGGSAFLQWNDSDGTSCEYADGTTMDPLFDFPSASFYHNGMINEGVKADFTASDLNPPKYSTILLTDLSSGNPVSWIWSFDRQGVVFVSGTSNLSQNPQVQFTEGGLYTVTLKARNIYGSDSEIKTAYIRVGTPGVWTGTLSGSWSDGHNWENWQIPDQSVDVIIPATAPNWPVVSGDLHIGIDCKSIILTGSSSTLTVNGNFIINN